MKKVLILAPRLDCMFKEGPVPTERGPISPIRQHWKKFIDGMINEYSFRKSHSVKVIELPLWQFSTQLVDELGADIVFVPHKENHNFFITNGKAYYYMQTVFPWMFSVDHKGWGGGASRYPFDIDSHTDDPKCFFKYKERVSSNQSKFDQPSFKEIALPEDYVFFPCQIPHDETIKWHSNISVESAFEETCKVTRDMRIGMIAKGHPVNPASMQGLKEISKKYPHVIWYDDISIHQLIPQARCVVVVNSGTGMESLLHKVPVVTFGKAEYDVVTNKSDLYNLREIIESPKFDETRVYKFFNAWDGWCYDSNVKLDYCKLP